MILNSIKWRLQIWYGLILVAVLAGFGFTAYQLERGRVIQRLDGELHRRANAIAESLRPPRGQQRGGQGQGPMFDGPPMDAPEDRQFQPQVPRDDYRMPPMVAGLFDETDTNGFYYVFFWRPGMKYIRSANAPSLDVYHWENGPFTQVNNLAPQLDGPGQPPGPPLQIDEDPMRPRGGQRRLLTAGQPEPPQRRGDFLEVTVRTPRGDRILVGRNMKPELWELRRTGIVLAAVGGGILLLGLAGGWWLAQRAIRPIADISSAAAKIATGDLSQRIQSSDTESELGQLATTLNSTFARLEASFAQQAQFTSDAAHELRTPVSVILTQTQSTLNKERSAGEYKETLEACQRAAQRMRRLTESLLQLARIDAGQEVFRREPFDLASTTQGCVELIRPLAADKQITIHTDLAQAKCSGDSDRIAQVITNLLTNAIKYNNEGGEIRVTSRLENGMAVVSVADNGPGISAEDLPRVFERFYRADKARSSSQGNAGLGLSICQAIVEAHGGTMDATSEPGKGAAFTVRLPV